MIKFTITPQFNSNDIKAMINQQVAANIESIINGAIEPYQQELDKYGAIPEISVDLESKKMSCHIPNIPDELSARINNSLNNAFGGRE